MGKFTDKVFSGLYQKLDSQDKKTDQLYEKLKQDLDSQQAQIEELEKEVRNFSDLVPEVTKPVEDIHCRQEELNAHISDFSNNLALGLETAKNDLEGKVEEVKKQTEEIKNQTEEIKNQVDESRKTIELGSQNQSQLIGKLKSNTEGRIEDLIASYERDILVGGSRYNWNVHRLNQISDEIVSLYNKPEKSNLTDKQLIKNMIQNKWRLIDRFEEKYEGEEELVCPVCKKRFLASESEILESECVFLGGKLKRHRCPQCNVIFGPSKMFMLTDEEFSDEYAVHYSVFSEGDSTEAEIRTFYRLNPEKDKKYLNYGAGSWSKTIETLREQGFDIIGFDPYAPAKSEFIINDWDELCKQKFDGIFSHDLLEHLRDPIGELNKMSEILNSDGSMVHSTACYNYVYEYTRFHLFFYTGTSLKEICDQTNLEMIAREENNEEMTVDYTFIHKKED